MTGDYNGFKGDLRDKVGQLQSLYIRDGFMLPPKKCCQCGQSQGRIIYHLEDYREPLNMSQPLCFMCHMMLHCCKSSTYGFRSVERQSIYTQYVAAVRRGYCKLLTNPEALFTALREGTYEIS